jgi:hypothetical protein
MQCLKRQRSFLWIGNNDVLGYATTGGDGTDLTFQVQWELGLMPRCFSKYTGGAKVVANIPYVNTLPFSRL